MKVFNLGKLTKESTLNSIDINELLMSELNFFGISKELDFFKIQIGESTVKARNLEETVSFLDDGIKELKSYIFHLWNELYYISEILLENSGGNQISLDNLIFLNSVKKSYFLSKKFSKLKKINNKLLDIMNSDISETHMDIICKFNQKYIEIKSTHLLILDELYRKKLINKIFLIEKQAQIEGPFSHLDLPMSERVWDAREDEENFDLRDRAKKQQSRYNPENGKSGFYFVWQDRNRDPYSFDDTEDESPYPTSYQFSIP